MGGYKGSCGRRGARGMKCRQEVNGTETVPCGGGEATIRRGKFVWLVGVSGGGRKSEKGTSEKFGLVY